MFLLKTLFTVSIVLFGQKVLSFELENENDPSSRELVESYGLCPTGFVIPDVVNGSGNLYANRSINECASYCRMPMYTEEEWEEFRIIDHLSADIGLPLIIAFIVTYWTNKEKRSHYLILSFGVLSGIQTLVVVIMQTMTFEEKYCRNNAEPIDHKDGFTMCNVQSFVQVYVGLALCICWCIQSMGMYCKIVLNMKIQGFDMWRHVRFIFLLPLVPCFIVWYYDAYGYSLGGTTCFMSKKGKDMALDSKVFYIPLLVLTCAGCFCMGSVFLKVSQLLFTGFRRKRRTRSLVEPDFSTEMVGRHNSSNMSFSDDGVDPDGEPSPLDGDLGSYLSNNTGTYKTYEEDFRTRSEYQSSAAGDRGNPYLLAPSPSPGKNTSSSPSPVLGVGESNKQLELLEMTKPLSAQTDEANGSMWELLSFLRTPLAFAVSFLVIFSSFLSVGMWISSKRHIMLDSYDAFAACAVAYYDSAVGNASWMPICGSVPDIRVEPSTRIFMICVFNCQSICIFVLNAPGIYKVWERLYQLHLKHLVNQCRRHPIASYIFRQNSVESFVEVSVASNEGSEHVSAAASVEEEEDMGDMLVFTQDSSFRRTRSPDSIIRNMARSRKEMLDKKFGFGLLDRSEFNPRSQYVPRSMKLPPANPFIVDFANVEAESNAAEISAIETSAIETSAIETSAIETNAAAETTGAEGTNDGETNSEKAITEVLFAKVSRSFLTSTDASSKKHFDDQEGSMSNNDKKEADGAGDAGLGDICCASV